MVDLIELIFIEKVTSGFAEAKMIAVDEGQETEDVKGDLTTTPAILFKVLPFETSDLGDDIQEAEVEVEVKLVTKTLRGGKDKIRHGGTGHAALASKLYATLQGTSGKLSEISEFSTVLPADDYEIFNSMSRIEVQPDKGSSALKTTTQTFTMYAKDYSAVKSFQKVTADFYIENFDFSC